MVDKMEQTNNTILSTCICGSTKFLYVLKSHPDGNHSFKCSKCGKQGPLTNSIEQARSKWNHMQTELKKKKSLENKSKKNKNKRNK